MRMHAYLTTFTRVATLVLLLSGAAAVPADADVTDDSVVEQVQAAKTAADHEALAAYFRAQAAAAAANAKKHEAMTMPMGGSRDIWANHCKSLVKTFNEQQKDYTALAAEQEKLAKEAGK